MGNTCKTCQRDDVDHINQLITKPTALRNIVARVQGVTLAGLQRHKEKCLESLWAEVRDKRRSGLLAEVDEIKADIAQLHEDFPDNGNVRVGLIGKRLEALDKEAKLTGAYQQEKKNERDTQLENVLKAVEVRALAKGITIQEELRDYLENYATNVPESFKMELASNLPTIG